MNKTSVRNAEAEIRNRKEFIRWVTAETNDLIEAVGINNLYGVLYVLARYGTKYDAEIVHVSPDNVARIIEGHEAYVDTFAYVNRAYKYHESDEESVISNIKAGMDVANLGQAELRVVMHVENRILRVSNYYDLIQDTEDGAVMLAKTPKERVVGADHPAAVNFSNSFIVN